MNCNHCNKEFTQVVIWQRFCSDSCRVMSFNGEDIKIKLRKRFLDLLKNHFLKQENIIDVKENDDRYTYRIERFAAPSQVDPLETFEAFDKFYIRFLENMKHESFIINETYSLLEGKTFTEVDSIKEGNFVLSNKIFNPFKIKVEDGVYYAKSPDANTYVFQEPPIAVIRTGLPDLRVGIKDSAVWYGIEYCLLALTHKNPVVNILKN